MESWWFKYEDVNSSYLYFNTVLFNYYVQLINVCFIMSLFHFMLFVK